MGHVNVDQETSIGKSPHMLRNLLVYFNNQAAIFDVPKTDSTRDNAIQNAPYLMETINPGESKANFEAVIKAFDAAPTSLDGLVSHMQIV